LIDNFEISIYGENLGSGFFSSIFPSFSCDLALFGP
jgi:hypothetical protein